MLKEKGDGEPTKGGRDGGAERRDSPRNQVPPGDGVKRGGGKLGVVSGKLHPVKVD